jgi:hypothetical protein
MPARYGAELEDEYPLIKPKTIRSEPAPRRADLGTSKARKLASVNSENWIRTSSVFIKPSLLPIPISSSPKIAGSWSTRVPVLWVITRIRVGCVSNMAPGSVSRSCGCQDVQAVRTPARIIAAMRRWDGRLLVSRLSLHDRI